MLTCDVRAHHDVCKRMLIVVT